MKKESRFHKYPAIRHRTMKSRKKYAELCMSISKSLWAALFITLSGGILLFHSLPVNNRLIHFGGICISALLAFRFRTVALDIYDLIQEEEDENRVSRLSSPEEKESCLSS
jgi:hypothetical protein